MDDDMIYSAGKLAEDELVHPYTSHDRVVITKMYPNILITFNIDKTTKLATALVISGVRDMAQLEDLFSNAADTTVSAVHLGSTYFNLPNYDKMLQLFDQQRSVA